MATLAQIQVGLMNFIEKELAVNAKGFQKFLIYGASFIISNQSQQLFSELIENPVAQTLNYVDKDGNINIDAIYNMAKYASQKSGKFTVAGIILDETDMEKLYKYVKEAK